MTVIFNLGIRKKEKREGNCYFKDNCCMCVLYSNGIFFLWCLTKNLSMLSEGCKNHFLLPEAACASGEVRAQFRVICYTNEKMHTFQEESR